MEIYKLYPELEFANNTEEILEKLIKAAQDACNVGSNL